MGVLAIAESLSDGQSGLPSAGIFHLPILSLCGAGYFGGVPQAQSMSMMIKVTARTIKYKRQRHG
ncbi:MAG TPA: hypothetical protein VLT86_19135, partial [Vicinamibacterales bacterium]|nr:hypothetical protein [Vicinamibacterales bacterium]